MNFYGVTDETYCFLKALGEIRALIKFSEFNKGEIKAITLGNSKLPTGITRHVIIGRILGLRVALDLLKEGWIGESEKLVREELVRKLREGSDRIRNPFFT
ncbi:MAG: hypothetical protein B6U69_00945 [Thermofilum sp. ex4484_15]|nr:MAG: hypothetical protein B6U69_00945 [Thermofilum sp. ex4484_15]